MSKIKHIVLLKFKDEVSQEQRENFFADLLEVTENVEGIEDYVSGPNMSPENMNQGFSHSFIITFHDVAARDSYLTHPEHEKLKSSAMPLMESVIVMDFEV